METTTYKRLKSRPKDNFPDKIIVHHIGGTNANPLLDTSYQTAEDVEKYHLSIPWEGLGYHYVIEKFGGVWKGRPEHYHGAHTLQENYRSIAICLSGNFDTTLPTKEQEVALIELLKDIMARHKISKERIYPHRRFQNKTCFGSKLPDTWASDLLIEKKPDRLVSVRVKVPESKVEKLLAFVKTI